jgi:uncharacterized protein
MAHPNEDLLRRGYEAFGSGDINTVLALFDDDIAWHTAGSNQTSGDYRGHQEVLGYFGKLMELSGGSFHLDIHDIVANDTHGVALVTTHGERDGQDCPRPSRPRSQAGWVTESQVDPRRGVAAKAVCCLWWPGPRREVRPLGTTAWPARWRSRR